MTTQPSSFNVSSLRVASLYVFQDFDLSKKEGGSPPSRYEWTRALRCPSLASAIARPSPFKYRFQNGCIFVVIRNPCDPEGTSSRSEPTVIPFINATAS